MNDIVIIVILTVVALITSIVSAILGMGGGIMLLAAMFSVLPHRVVIPLHACVQLVSNFTRVLAYLKNVNWRILAFFSAGSIPGLVGGYFLFQYLYQYKDSLDPYMKVFVALFILYAAYAKKSKEGKDVPLSRFALVGSYAAPISLFFGATGPIVAPYFIRQDLYKEMVVATKAICQFSVHAMKLGIFYWLWKSGVIDNFKFEHLTLGMMLISLVLAAIVGTVIGKKLMKKVSEENFKKYYFLILNIVAAKILIFDGIWGIVQSMSSSPITP